MNKTSLLKRHPIFSSFLFVVLIVLVLSFFVPSGGGDIATGFGGSSSIFPIMMSAPFLLAMFFTSYKLLKSDKPYQNNKVLLGLLAFLVLVTIGIFILFISPASFIPY